MIESRKRIRTLARIRVIRVIRVIRLVGWYKVNYFATQPSHCSHTNTYIYIHLDLNSGPKFSHISLYTVRSIFRLFLIYLPHKKTLKIQGTFGHQKLTYIYIYMHTYTYIIIHVKIGTSKIDLQNKIYMHTYTYIIIHVKLGTMYIYIFFACLSQLS